MAGVDAGTDEHNEIPLSSREVLRLEPGDIVVFTCPEKLSLAQLGALKESAVAIFGEDVKTAILDGGVDLSVIRLRDGSQRPIGGADVLNAFQSLPHARWRGRLSGDDFDRIARHLRGEMTEDGGAP